MCMCTGAALSRERTRACAPGGRCFTSGMWGARIALGLASALALSAAACAGSNNMICQRDPTTGSSLCGSSNAADAVAVTGVAAGVYAFTGCTVNGCELPNRCNTKTKLCEAITCRENIGCPAGYSCDMVTLTCR
jgi:hypothetical protein